MRLTLRKSDNIDDWYFIERAEHDGRRWMEPTRYGMALRTSARFSDADVEGSASEMLDIADAIERHKIKNHKRCAVDATTEPVKFHSPRNSQIDGETTYAEALELAIEIRRLLGAQDENA